MRSLPVAGFYQLGQLIGWIRRIHNIPEDERILAYKLAADGLDQLVTGNFIPLSHCERTARELRDLLRRLQKSELKLDKGTMLLLQFDLQNFDSNLMEELEKSPTFFVSSKNGYDTKILLERAELLFSEPVQRSLSPDGLTDIREAGRCIALMVPTAAAFHLFRAAERFLRAYHAVVTKGAEPPKSRDWGAYIRELEKYPDVNKEVLTDLDRIRSRYRNPIIHPEATVPPEDICPLLDRLKSVLHDIVADVDRLWR